MAHRCFAQEYQDVEVYSRDTAKNEISLNILNVLVFGAMDFSYERILSDHTSLGVAIFSKVFNKNEGENVDFSKAYSKSFSITPKFKYFLSEEQTASGLYAEVFGMFSNGKNKKEVDAIDPETGNTIQREVSLDFTDLALGIGAGGKFVAKQGFLVDVSFGLGRNFFHKDSPDIVILPSVNVGYRF
mgnify:CR=1 FL=1